MNGPDSLGGVPAGIPPPIDETQPIVPPEAAEAAEAPTPIETAAPPSKKRPKDTVSGLSERLVPSNQIWRSETVFGRVVNFFEQAVFVLAKVWPNRPPKVDQRLMSSLHGDRIAADYPGLSTAPLSKILKYLIPFLESQEGDAAPPPDVLKSLKQTAKWAAELEKVSTYKNKDKRDKQLADLSEDIGKKLGSLEPGQSCIIPGGWRGGGTLHQAFFQATKNEDGKFTFKIISRDINVNPQSELFSAAGLKIHPVTTFTHIDQAEVADSLWLQSLLNLQMPLDIKERGPDITTLPTLFSHLADRIEPDKPVEEFRKERSDRTEAKNIWLVVDMLGQGSKVKETSGERKKLQLKVNSLFQFYGSVRGDLANNTTNQILLLEGVQSVSKLACALHELGKLTEEEVSFLNYECGLIEAEVTKAQNQLKTSKKDPLVQRLAPYVFKRTKINAKPVDPNWVSAKDVQASPSERAAVTAPAEAMSETISRPAIDKPDILGKDIKAHLANLKSECDKLAEEGKEFELQTKITDTLYDLPLGPRGTDSTKWGTAKDIEECAVLLNNLSQLFIESAQRTDTLSPEKRLLLLKVGVLQESLGNLNSQHAGVVERFTASDYWKNAIADTLNHQQILSGDDLHRNEKLAGSPVCARSYSEREAKLQFILKDASLQMGWYRYRRKGEENLSSSTTPQSKAMDRQIEMFKKVDPKAGKRGNYSRLMWGEKKPFPNKDNYPNSWNRKYQHPLLAEVAKYVRMSDHQEDFLQNHRAILSEQGIRDNPRAFVDLIVSKVSIEDKSLPDISQEDLGDLLTVLGRGSALEMMGLIRQKPYLLAEPDIRTLLEQVTFGGRNLFSQLSNNADDPAYQSLSHQLATWIDEQAQAFKKQGKVHEFLFMVNLANSLNKAAPELPKEQAQFFNFNYYPALKELAHSSLDPSKPEFENRHAIWTNLILSLEGSETLTGEQMADLLQGLAVIQSAPVEIHDFDPLQQVHVKELKEKWKDQIKDFVGAPQREEYRKHILDSILKATGIPLPADTWTGQFPLYKAGAYEIDLVSGVVKNTQDGWISRGIPADLRENPKVQTVFPSGELQRVSSQFSQQDGNNCFIFDTNGERNLITSKDDKVHVYKELGFGKEKSWVEAVTKDQVFGPPPTESEPLSFEGPVAFLSSLKKMNKEMKEKPDIPDFLNQPNLTFWVDPKKSSHVFVRDENQTVLYELVFKKNSKGKRTLEGVIDLRSGSPGEGKLREIGHLNEDMHPLLQQLSALDSPGNITVWKTDKKIDQVELFRYDLSFVEKEGQIVCTSPKLNGWILEASPPQHLKKGLPNVVLLRHPTIASQYRMILPDQKTLPPEPMVKFTLGLALKTIKNMAKGRILSLESKDPIAESLKLDKSSPKQDFWIFDIDPATAELHPVTESSTAPFLYMAKLSLLNHQPERALEFILQMGTLPRQWNNKDFEQINEFLEAQADSSPDMIALQLQCALVAKAKGMPNAGDALVEFYQLYLRNEGKVTGILRPKHTLKFTDPLITKLAHRPFLASTPRTQRPDIEKLSGQVFNQMKGKKESTFKFLSRDISKLESHFDEVYKTATGTPIDDQKFKELDLTLRSLTQETEPEAQDYSTILHNYLTRVLEIRKANINILLPPFPDIPKESHERDAVATLRGFFAKVDREIKKAEVNMPKSAERVAANSEFDMNKFADQMEEAFKEMAAANPDARFDDLTLEELEEKINARTPQTTTVDLDPAIGQSLYRKEELKTFFEPSRFRAPVPTLDLSELKKSPNIAVKEAADFLDEGLQIARDELAKTTPMTLINGEESRQALEQNIVKKKAEFTERREEARKKVLEIIHTKSSSLAEMQRRAKLVKNIDMDLLFKHFLQNDLEGLAGNLPKDVDFDQLKSALSNYLLEATEVQRLDAALSEVQQLSAEKEGLTSQSMANLFTILTAERQFDPSKNPQLLLFEYESNLLLRGVQLKMVQDVLQDPTKVYVAATGVGKTSVVTVLAGLMMADGTNLVTTIFPKQLFHENLADVESKLGKIYKRSIYPLEFNMNTPTVTEDGKPLFEKMFADLIQVTLEKGVVATTVESQQALEQKWILMMDQQSKAPRGSISLVDRTNLAYLTKIMDYMNERQKLVLDEVDKALSTREERHFKTGDTEPVPEHIWQNTLELYDRLLAEPELGLRQNLQGKGVTEEKRLEILQKVARETAKDIAEKKGINADELIRYFLGEDEAVLQTAAGWTPEEKDKIALFKDQFQIYLPLTLAKTGNVKYMRSKDGVRTVPCLASDIPRESSEPDEMLEKVNYDIQSYLQTGIRDVYVERWALNLKRAADARVSNEGFESIDATPEALLFASHFPGYSLSKLTPKDIPNLVKEVNKDTERIKFFLRMSLQKLEISDSKISVDGHNLVSMANTTTGFSATTSSLRALPRALNTKETADKAATGRMVLNMLRKVQNPDGSLPPMMRFDPANPQDIIPQALEKDPDIQVVIDGLGVAALHGLPFGTPAQQLLAGQPENSKIKGIILGGEGNLQQVQTDRGILSKDAAGLKPSVLGGYFGEWHARGADFTMAPGARALITASKDQGFEEVLQTVGRLRRDDQRACYAVANGDPITDVDALVLNAVVKSVDNEEDDINKGERKNLRDMVRKEMLSGLRKTARQEGINAMLDRFLEVEPEGVLISHKTKSYSTPGAYAEMHSAINRPDKDPIAEIDKERLKYLAIAKRQHLTQAVAELDTMTLPKEIAVRLTKPVRGSEGPTLDQEVEVEVQTEIETQVEIETEVEVEKTKAGPKYQTWLDPKFESYTVHPLQSTNQAYDPVISFSENFFPLSANIYKNPQKEFVRKPRDHMQNPAHFVKIDISTSSGTPEITEATILDSLESSSSSVLTIKGRLQQPQTESNLYDMRLKRFVKGPLAQPGAAIPEEIKPKLDTVTAQTRFFNGEVSGYTPEEFKALRDWLATSDPKKMEAYFKEALKNKPQAQQTYPFSPLKKLFIELTKDNP